MGESITGIGNIESAVLKQLKSTNNPDLIYAAQQLFADLKKGDAAIGTASVDSDSIPGITARFVQSYKKALAQSQDGQLPAGTSDALIAGINGSLQYTVTGIANIERAVLAELDKVEDNKRLIPKAKEILTRLRIGDQTVDSTAYIDKAEIAEPVAAFVSQIEADEERYGGRQQLSPDAVIGLIAGIGNKITSPQISQQQIAQVLVQANDIVKYEMSSLKMWIEAAGGTITVSDAAQAATSPTAQIGGAGNVLEEWKGTATTEAAMVVHRSAATAEKGANQSIEGRI
jgi:hypothetical protein